MKFDLKSLAIGLAVTTAAALIGVKALRMTKPGQAVVDWAFNK